MCLNLHSRRHVSLSPPASNHLCTPCTDTCSTLQVPRSHQSLRSAGVPVGDFVTPLPTPDVSTIPHLQRPQLHVEHTSTCIARSQPQCMMKCKCVQSINSKHLTCLTCLQMQSDNIQWECGFCNSINAPSEAHELRVSSNSACSASSLLAPVSHILDAVITTLATHHSSTSCMTSQLYM